MIITEEDKVIAKSNLYDQPEKELFNYIRSRSLLEYAHWLLAEIDYFDEYAEFSEKILQFDAIRSRMQYIEQTLESATQENDSNSEHFKFLFNILYTPIRSMFDRIKKNLNEAPIAKPNLSELLSDRELDETYKHIDAFERFQQFLPTDCYEHFLLRIGIKNSRSFFLDWSKVWPFSEEGSILIKDSIYDNVQAIDICEQAISMINHDKYLAQEHALCLTHSGSSISFKDLQRIHNLLLVTWRQECANSITLLKAFLDQRHWNESALTDRCTSVELLLNENIDSEKALKELEISHGMMLYVGLNICKMWLELSGLPYEDYDMLKQSKSFRTHLIAQVWKIT